MMDLKRLLIAGFLLPVLLSARELRILTIGNSFAESVFRYLPQVAASGGDKAVMQRANIGGASLERHVREIAKCENDPAYRPYQNKYTLRELLTQDKWDIVTVQQASHLAWHPESYEPWLGQLIAYIRRFAPQAEIVLQETWAYRQDGFRDKNRCEQARMQSCTTSACRKFAAQYHLRIIPAGTAVAVARVAEPVQFSPIPPDQVKKLKYPELPVEPGAFCAGYYWKTDPATGVHTLTKDTNHLNRRGEYLQACVWYAKLFNGNPEKLTFRPPEITKTDAVFMRRIARLAVELHEMSYLH